MSRNVIRDGQTRRAALKPVPRQHDGLVFSYRPMLAADFQVSEAAIGEVRRPEDGVKVLAKVLADHIKEWSEEDEKGNPLPITQKNWERMPYGMMRQVYMICAGFTPSDEIEDNDREESDRVTQLLEGATSQVEAAQKN